MIRVSILVCILEMYTFNPFTIRKAAYKGNKFSSHQDREKLTGRELYFRTCFILIEMEGPTNYQFISCQLQIKTPASAEFALSARAQLNSFYGFDF